MFATSRRQQPHLTASDCRIRSTRMNGTPSVHRTPCNSLSALPPPFLFFAFRACGRCFACYFSSPAPLLRETEEWVVREERVGGESLIELRAGGTSGAEREKAPCPCKKGLAMGGRDGLVGPCEGARSASKGLRGIAGREKKRRGFPLKKRRTEKSAFFLKIPVASDAVLGLTLPPFATEALKEFEAREARVRRCGRGNASKEQEAASLSGFRSCG
jgi:hypothetical protein